MTNQIFFNETTLNNKIQVMTTLKLEGKGIRNFGGQYIVEFDNKIFKGNVNYWMTQKAFKNLSSQFNVTRVCF
jgi:hypothetical protein